MEEIKNEIQIDLKKEDTEKWVLCCSSIHKVEVVFFSQITFILMLTIFSMLQIINKADHSEIYFSMISSCLGIIIPAPSLHSIIDKK